MVKGRKVPGRILTGPWCYLLGNDIYHIFPTDRPNSLTPPKPRLKKEEGKRSLPKSSKVLKSEIMDF